MNVILENISKDYQGRLIFENISGRINKGDKIGLIGNNGVGKTTLAKIIARIEGFEGGSINYCPVNSKIVYLREGSFQDQRDIVDHKSSDESVAGYIDIVDIEIKKLLMDMGIREESWAKPLGTMSGGEKTKIMLAKVLSQDFDLLILDEPTNHLDIESVALLEKLIKRLQKTILIISHDRYFLDNTVSKIWYMESREIKEYTGNYSSYKIQREIEIKNILKEHQKQRKEIQHLKTIINDRKQWFIKAHKGASQKEHGQREFYRAKAKKHISVMRSKEKQLKRLEDNKVERPREELSPAFDIINKGVINLKLPRYLIQAKGLSKSYGNKVIFEHISFDVQKGDKIGILGKNGSGKTTLLQIINSDQQEYGGYISINPSVKISYFSQQLETLQYQKSILDNVLCEGANQTDVRILLASLLFKGEDVFKKVKNLSMGEKSRVAVAKIILSGANLLVLDEITNYMDITSKEKIEEVLQSFTGSILFVSHDRYFINSIATKIFEFDSKTMRIYDGNYDFYLSKKQEDKLSKDTGESYRAAVDAIAKLECQLAYIGGRLSENITEEEKTKLDKSFLDISKELKKYKQSIARP